MKFSKESLGFLSSSEESQSQQQSASKPDPGNDSDSLSSISEVSPPKKRQRLNTEWSTFFSKIKKSTPELCPPEGVELPDCTSIQTFFLRNRMGYPGYDEAGLEMIYTDICAHSALDDSTIVALPESNLMSKCICAQITPGRLHAAFKKGYGRVMYTCTIANPGSEKTVHPTNHRLQLQVHVLSAAWFRLNEAKRNKYERLMLEGKGGSELTLKDITVEPEAWQWESDKEVHHRCNHGHKACHNGLHLKVVSKKENMIHRVCLLYTSPSPRDRTRSRMPSSA